jgi:hypothetical protein
MPPDVSIRETPRYPLRAPPTKDIHNLHWHITQWIIRHGDEHLNSPRPPTNPMSTRICLIMPKHIDTPNSSSVRTHEVRDDPHPSNGSATPRWMMALGHVRVLT